MGTMLKGKSWSGVELLKDIEVALGARGRYLDVGCGRGEWLWAARQCGWEFEGVDPSSTFIEWGRRNLNVDGRARHWRKLIFRETISTRFR